MPMVVADGVTAMMSEPKHISSTEAVSAPRATRAIEAPRGYSSPPDDTDR